MAKSVEEQLAEVEEAIEVVQKNGQRYTIADRELWRADLADLEKRRKSLKAEADRKARGGVRAVRVVPL